MIIDFINDTEIAIRRVHEGFHAKRYCKRRLYQYFLPTLLLLRKSTVGTDKTPTKTTLDDEMLAKLNRLLKKYEGNHLFHNFTKGVRNDQQQAWRKMIKVEVCYCTFTIVFKC